MQILLLLHHDGHLSDSSHLENAVNVVKGLLEDVGRADVDFGDNHDQRDLEIRRGRSCVEYVSASTRTFKARARPKCSLVILVTPMFAPTNKKA